ncbi:MAG: 30S ribosomal protein S6 [Candidatus Jorgensenbacteria bacterium]|nr:30S ribosomal protein S6 [Candidatus Jorgensenbacteria bacterium]
MEENKEKNIYEITFHVLTEENAGDVRRCVEKCSGTITYERPLEKVRLAYPVKKQTYGFMGVLGFDADPEQVRAILNELKLGGLVLRSLIHKVLPQKERQKKAKQGAGAPSQQPAEGMKRLRPFGQALSNEALEKKIEEILQ